MRSEPSTGGYSSVVLFLVLGALEEDEEEGEDEKTKILSHFSSSESFSEVNLQPEVYSSVVLFLVLGALEEDEEEGEDEKTKILSHFLNSESFSKVNLQPESRTR